MSVTLTKLRELNVEEQIGDLDREVSRQSMGEYLRSGVRFVASHPKIEEVYYRAVQKLMNNIRLSVSGTPLLFAGDLYIGCWLESTGTLLT